MAKLFLLGATGFVGGTFLTQLLKEESDKKKRYSITVLHRDPKQKEAFESLGVTSLVGSLDDTDLIYKTSLDFDIIVNAASSDHLKAVQSIVSAGQKRSEQSLKTVFIHVSGTGEITDDSFGQSSDKIWSDENLDAIHAIPTTVIHRDVDSLIFSSGNSLFTTVILCPPAIYGTGSGLFNTHSMIVLLLAQAAIEHPAERKVYILGPGKNIWSQVHVFDLAAFFILLLHKLDDNPSAVSINKEGFYFVESGEDLELAEIGEEIATTLSKIKGSEWKVENLERGRTEAVFGLPEALGSLFASNSRSKAVKARALGWEPKIRNAKKDVSEQVEYVVQSGHDSIGRFKSALGAASH